ncbi:hypothetical protein Goklo_017549 [Gossypium klotzschianum]|uniref:Uncharacterized protein n=1 Tax=Gossypium klotzschianum TaxID=34286 RepID=A0A7J8UIH5_9ROSI|nr:hypothetical protein [Gossypium klotzschianum]
MEQSLGSSGVRRATKKVRRRDDDPLDVGDMETDDGGSKVASFKDKLLGWASNESVKEDYEEDEFELLDGDVLTKTMNGISNIKFSERVHTLIQKTMAKTMIIKFLGRKIGFNNMVSKPHILWKVRRTIITRRTIYGQYLTVKSWSLWKGKYIEWSMRAYRMSDLALAFMAIRRRGVTYYPNRVEVSQTQSSATASAPTRVCGRGNRRLVGQRVVTHIVDTQVRA